jgi:hypothetical protein
VVGTVQFTVAEPDPQVQVSVNVDVVLMLGRVWVPDAAFVPDQAPLAAQLDATGEVDQVSTGT